VNGGIDVRSVTGNFDVKTVNGSVSFLDGAGTGHVNTVNGKINLSFVNPPNGELEVKTVNGAIEVAYPRTTNAVLNFKTLHGGVYTNFPANLMQELPNDSMTTEKSKGMTRISSKSDGKVRLGGGGPNHKFTTVNGSIEIKEKGV